jgi:hypothetical protein
VLCFIFPTALAHFFCLKVEYSSYYWCRFAVGVKVGRQRTAVFILIGLYWFDCGRGLTRSSLV